jgi:REP element-mobilizing transposase RayT
MHTSQTPGYSALRKGRFSQPNGIYFITFVTEERIPWFTDDELARVMCRNFYHQAAIADSSILCYVVMPDHVHFLVQLASTPLHKVTRRIKSRTASLLNKCIGRSGRFWQPGYYDHALRKDEDLLGVARYIVANPLRSKLVSKLGAYPYWNARWL